VTLTLGAMADRVAHWCRLAVTCVLGDVVASSVTLKCPRGDAVGARAHHTFSLLASARKERSGPLLAGMTTPAGHKLTRVTGQRGNTTAVRSLA